MSFPRLKLSYFDITGRAEATRLAFFIGGIPFEDDRFPRPDMATRKHWCPYGVVPILQVNDEVLAESGAIARYAGRLAGLYPTNNPSAALMIDEIMHGVDEFGEQFRTWWMEQNPEKKKSYEAQLLTEVIPTCFQYLEDRLAKMNDLVTFQDDSRVFIHELWLDQFLQTFLLAGFMPFVPNDIADRYKHLMAAVAKVRNHPRVKEWRAIQPVRPSALKLVSFPLTGREVPIRSALQLGGVVFEDVRLASHQEFRKEFPGLPSHQSLALVVDGKPVASQSLAALRYASNLTSLYPTTDSLTALRIDEIFGVVDAFYNAILPALTADDPATQQSLQERLGKDDIPKTLGGLDKRLEARGTAYAVGDHLTIADLAIHGILTFLESGALPHVSVTSPKDFPQLTKLQRLVASHLQECQPGPTAASP